jgi:hypothetical protein
MLHFLDRVCMSLKEEYILSVLEIFVRMAGS